MSEILTERFKILLADQFYFSLCLCSNTTYYMVGGKPEEFTGNTIPVPGESIFESIYDFHDQMLFGKIVNPEDVQYMIRNIPWVSGIKYDIYDDIENDIANKNYYVVADQGDGSYGVFKLIYRNPNLDRASTVKPLVNQTQASDEIYITGDGYHWKYMYSIDSTTYTKFATSNYVPIVVDTNVTANAVAGTIDAIQIESIGAQYNNYASGIIKQTAIDGDVTKFALETDDLFTVNTYDLIYSGNTTFSEGDFVNVTVPGQSAVNAEIYKTTSTTISIIINDETEEITQGTVDAANGFITVTAANTSANVVRIRSENLPNLSRDNNFYKNSVLYIRNGTGAGQTKDIIDYSVSGNDRVVTLDSAFTVTPDTTSAFDILPKITITGDGTGAIALPVIDTSANSIFDIQIINRGVNYTFATATIIGNTGIIDSNGDPVIANSAILRPIISPQGGHGSDLVEELYGTNIGISVTFANTEVLPNVSYSKVGLVRNLLHNDVQLTLNALDTGDFTVGEIIRQEDPTTSSGLSKARGTITAIDTDNNILTLTNVLGVFEVSANNEIVGSSANATITSINRDITKFNNDIVLDISLVSGTFQVNETIVQTNSNAEGYVIAANTTQISVVKVFGEFTNNISDTIIGETSSAIGIVTDVSNRKTIDNSGDVLYIENLNEVNRSSSTSEQIKLIIKF